MSGYLFKILLLAALFVALCVKGGQLSSSAGVMAMTRLNKPVEVEVATPPETPRPVEENFRGLSPRPSKKEGVFPAKNAGKNAPRKVVRRDAQSAKAPAAKTDRKN